MFILFQTLTQEIGSVGLKKLSGDRNVENYDFEAAQLLVTKEREAEMEEEGEEGELSEEYQESSEMMAKRYCTIYTCKMIFIARLMYQNTL